MRRQRRFDPERRLLVRARRRLTAQVAGAFSIVLALMGVVVYCATVNSQDNAARINLTLAAQESSVAQPPPCLWLFEQRGAVLERSPGAPAALPSRAALRQVAEDGRPRFDLVHAGGADYLIRTERRGDGVVQVATDLRYQTDERRRLLRTLAAAEIAALLAALLIGQVLAGRAIAPLGEALDRQRRFTADVSHELRGPLTRLYVRAQLAARRLRRDADPGRGVEDLERVVAGIGQLGEVVEDLLLSTQLRRHRRPFGPVDLAALADELVTAEKARAEERGVTITSRRIPDAPGEHVVRGAESALRRVVSALLDNALCHTNPGGHIWVTLSHAPDQVRLTVRDDGVGLDPRDSDRLFAPYVGGPRTAHRGLGLGLALVREVVDDHGGTIRVDGRPGAGATFTVRLPAHPTDPPPAPPPPTLTTDLWPSRPPSELSLDSAGGRPGEE
jgi:signal transduction histidine kinase